MAVSSLPSRLAIQLLVCATCGCGTLELSGVVRTVPVATPERGEREQPLDGSPLAGATITLRCPGDSAVRLRLTSDATGRFRHPFPGELSNGCILRVEKAGFHARELRLIEACAWGLDDSCVAASLSARLLEDTGDTRARLLPEEEP